MFYFDETKISIIIHKEKQVINSDTLDIFLLTWFTTLVSKIEVPITYYLNNLESKFLFPTELNNMGGKTSFCKVKTPELFW